MPDQNYILTKITPQIKAELFNSRRTFILLDVKMDQFQAIFCKEQTTDLSQNFSYFETNQSIYYKYQIAAQYAIQKFFNLLESDTLILID